MQPTSPMKPLVGILLAAGTGTRFGGQKLVAPLWPGATVAGLACRKLVHATDRVLAIVRPQESLLGRLLMNEGAEVLICEDADLGMGTSLAFGVRAASEAKGWLVALADMPLIESSTLKTLADALHFGHPLVIPRYQGRRGHPVGFGACHYQRLSQLQGDQGGRSILDNPSLERTEISFEDQGILLDIDTPEELDQYRLILKARMNVDCSSS